MKVCKFLFSLLIMLSLTSCTKGATLRFNDVLDLFQLNNKVNLPCPIAGPTVFAGGDGSPGNPYKISSAAQLNQVRNYLACNFEQILDINLTTFSPIEKPGLRTSNSGRDWQILLEPNSIEAMNTTNGNFFTGSYNGGNKKIIGHIFTPITDAQRVGAALFSVNAGTIENLVIQSATINGNLLSGVLTGINFGLIRNVTVDSSKLYFVNFDTLLSTDPRYIDHTSKENYALGLIAGANLGTIITANVNSGTIEGRLGGSAPTGSGIAFNIGGIAGIHRGPPTLTATISNSNVYTLSIYGKLAVGGAIGQVFHSAGNEEVTSVHVNYAEIQGEEHVGGLVGIADQSISLSSVTNSNVSALGSPGANIGGFAGSVKSQSSNISSCTVSSGTKVKANTNGTNIGGFVGSAQGTFIDSNVTDVTIGDSGAPKVMTNVGGFIGADIGATDVARSSVIDTSISSAGNSIGGFSGDTNSASTFEDSDVKGVQVVGQDFVGGFFGNYNSSTPGATRRCSVGDAGANISSVRGHKQVGGFAGQSSTRGEIFDSSAGSGSAIGKLTVTGLGTGLSNIGGFVGKAVNSTLTRNDIHKVSVQADGNGVGGFVGYTDQGTIDHSTVSNSTVRGSRFVGGFVGYNINSKIGHVTGCQVDDTYAEGDDAVGGFAGFLDINGMIENSTVNHSDPTYGAKAKSPSVAEGVGGFVGYHNNGEITDCSVTRGKVDGSDRVGGFVGFYASTNGKMIQRSFTSDVTIFSAGDTGGFVGVMGGSTGNIAVIESSYVINPNIQFTGISTLTPFGIGGFVGRMYDNTNITSSFVEGSDHTSNVNITISSSSAQVNTINASAFLGDATAAPAASLSQIYAYGMTTKLNTNNASTVNVNGFSGTHIGTRDSIYTLNNRIVAGGFTATACGYSCYVGGTGANIFHSNEGRADGNTYAHSKAIADFNKPALPTTSLLDDITADANGTASIWKWSTGSDTTRPYLSWDNRNP